MHAETVNVSKINRGDSVRINLAETPADPPKLEMVYVDIVHHLPELHGYVLFFAETSERPFFVCETCELTRFDWNPDA